jgi:hypothetical protein
MSNAMFQEQLTSAKAAMATTLRELKQTHAKELDALRKQILQEQSTVSNSIAERDAQTGLSHPL